MKIRLDSALVEQGLATSRERAKAVIMSGVVFVNNQRADKPGQTVAPEDTIEVRGGGLKYVSRGGLKLEKALAVFPIDLEGTTCIDIGASTGGFTDCMLQNGAAKVYAVDVGYGQLAWTLRTDPRVVNLERTNIRHVTEAEIPQQAGFISVDVSFISLGLVLPVAKGLLQEGGRMVCLVKPQFEAGREHVGKKGVVRDPAVHTMVLEKTVATALRLGFSVLGLDFSPVKGPEGNIEYLLFLGQGGQGENRLPEGRIADVVASSHNEL